MNICCPVQKNIGLNSIIAETFSCAPEYIIANTDNNDVKTVMDIGQLLQFGTCNPTDGLDGHNIDAVITCAIGEGQLHKFSRVDITVLKANGKTVGENLKLLQQQRLSQILPEKTAHHKHSE